MRNWLRQAVLEQSDTAANMRILTTNQKVAGSSPAERATEIPRFAGKTRIYSNGLGVTPALLAATWQ